MTSIDQENRLKGLKAEYLLIKDEISVVEHEIIVLRNRRDQLKENMLQIENQIKSSSMKLTSNNDVATNWSSKSDFPWSQKLQESLQSFQYASLRETQLEVINATLSCRNVFCLMKTGGGKSLCYQLPALMSDGITLVIAPLVSLIRDQVRFMNSIEPNTAALLSGKMDLSYQRMIFNEFSSSNTSPLRLLFTTPEKVHKSKLFMTHLQKAYQMKKFKRIVIDEAHCASQWGHDFRPDYAALGILKKLFHDVPILALTATASYAVRDDILRILNIDGSYSAEPFAIDDDDDNIVITTSTSSLSPTMLPPIIFTGDFDRPNLKFSVWMKPDDFDNSIMMALEALNRAPRQSAIIYCFTQKETESVAAALRMNGIRIEAYHAGLDEVIRNNTQDRWQQGDLHVVCATIAFGLGINKANVRLVLHFNVSKSLELYYQEAGRAGRDGGLSECILMYNPADILRVASVATEDLELLADGSTRHKILSMIRYCQCNSYCRRAIMMMTLNTGSTPIISDAPDMIGCECDSCQGSSSDSHSVRSKSWVEVSSELRAAIIQAVHTSQKGDSLALLTVKKLASIPTMKKQMASNHITLWQLTWIVCAMIYNDQLAIHINYTTYATILYVIAGRSRKVQGISIPVAMVPIGLSSTAEKKTIHTSSKKRKAEIFYIDDDEVDT